MFSDGMRPHRSRLVGILAPRSDRFASGTHRLVDVRTRRLTAPVGTGPNIDISAFTRFTLIRHAISVQRHWPSAPHRHLLQPSSASFTSPA